MSIKPSTLEIKIYNGIREIELLGDTCSTLLEAISNIRYTMRNVFGSAIHYNISVHTADSAVIDDITGEPVCFMDIHGMNLMYRDTGLFASIIGIKMIHLRELVQCEEECEEAGIYGVLSCTDGVKTVREYIRREEMEAVASIQNALRVGVSEELLDSVGRRAQILDNLRQINSMLEVFNATYC